MAGEPDWDGMGRRIPEHIVEGWEQFDALEPSGWDHFYSFFANAFVLVCRSLHNIETAGTVREEHFKWWSKPHEAPGMTDAQIMAAMDHWQALQADGTIPKPRTPAGKKSK